MPKKKKKTKYRQTNAPCIKAALHAAFILESGIVEATPDYLRHLTFDCLKFRAREYRFKSPWIAYCLFLERVLGDSYGFTFNLTRKKFLMSLGERCPAGSKHDIPLYLNSFTRLRKYADYLEDVLVIKIRKAVKPTYSIYGYLEPISKVQKCEPYLQQKYDTATNDLNKRYSLWELENERRKKIGPH